MKGERAGELGTGKSHFQFVARSEHQFVYIQFFIFELKLHWEIVIFGEDN